MKFNDLYHSVFLTERDELSTPDADKVAVPSDFDGDVDPMPLPDLAPAGEEGIEGAVGAASESGGSTLKDFVFKLEEYADELNGTEGASLASIVSNLDKPETPFEGISGRTSAEIVDAAKTLRSIAEKLKNFLIHSLK